MHRSGSKLFTPSKVGAGLFKRPDFCPATRAEQSDPAGQALRIFNLLRDELIKNPGQKIGLLYAANNKQAVDLRDSQSAAGKKIATINGGGQALVFGELVKLINKNKLMDKIHILPMSTSMNGGDNTGNNAVSTAIIDRDINYVENHIKAGFTVYGMPRMNKDKSFSEEYAIGGGVSKAWLLVSFPELGGKTQNEYLQEKLNRLQKKYHHAIKAKAASVATGMPVAKAAPAHESVLRDEPKAGTKVEVTSHLEPEKLKLIQARLIELKWSVEVHSDHDGKIDSATAKKGNESFKISDKKFTTQSKDVETFKAMLAAFKSAHRVEIPSVTVEEKAMIALWEQAYKAVYVGSPVPDNFVRIVDAKKVEAPAPRHTSPRP